MLGATSSNAASAAAKISRITYIHYGVIGEYWSRQADFSNTYHCKTLSFFSFTSTHNIFNAERSADRDPRIAGAVYLHYQTKLPAVRCTAYAERRTEKHPTTNKEKHFNKPNYMVKRKICNFKFMIIFCVRTEYA